MLILGHKIVPRDEMREELKNCEGGCPVPNCRSNLN